MSNFFSYIKSQIKYLKQSLPQITMALIVFVLTISGVATAIILRYLEFDGLVILFYSVITEAIGIILLYLFLKDYLKPQEEEKLTKKMK